MKNKDFLYSELISKPNIQGRIIPKELEVPLTNSGTVNISELLKLIKLNCQSINTNASNPTYYTYATDIKRNVEITYKGISHNIAPKNKSQSAAYINAKVSMDIPYILSNAIEINRTSQKENIDIPYSHIMLGISAIEKEDKSIDYYGIRLVIEERINQNPLLIDANVLGRLYAVNAKKIDASYVQVATKNNVALTTKHLFFEYSIADLLENVKGYFQETFSEDVKKALEINNFQNKGEKMKRPQNFDELLDIAKKRPDVHGALSQLGLSLKRVGHSMGGTRWQTETKSGTSGDLSAVAFIEKPDGSWIIFDNKGRTGQQSMDAITCLREMFSVSFDDAVYMLSGGAPSAPVAKPQAPTLERKAEPIEEHTYTPPTPTPDKLRHVKAYLIQTRKLPKELVLTLIDSGKISATERFKSKTAFCTFPITDENGNNVGTDMAATIDDLPKEYKKHLEKGSNADYAWCFSYEIEEITSETPIFFCEAPIDTMSLCALSGTPGVYVSMAGLKDRTFSSVSEKLGGKPIICVDNDEAGNAFAARHPGVTRLIAPEGKDWNDTLKYYVANNSSYAYSAPDAAAAPNVPLEDNVGGGHRVHHEGEDVDPKKENGALDKGASGERKKIISDTVDKALLNKGNINEKYNQKKISLVPEEVAKYVFQASAGQIDISKKYVAINGDNIWHEYQSHKNEIKETSLKQIPLSPENIKEAISAIYSPDIVECIFSDINNPTQKQSFVFAKKSIKGHYIVVEAIGGKSNPNIVPAMILQFKEEKLNEMFNFDKTFGELFFDNDAKKLNALNTKLNKENRVIVAQFVSKETIANTPRSPRFTNIIPSTNQKINTLDEKNSTPLYDEAPNGADNVGKQSQDELRAMLEGKVKNVVDNYRTDPRAFAEYVLFCSRFNNYSARNLLLIWAQYPHAQFVTSAYDFSHGLPDKNGKPTISEKIFVKKGERALRIWKPYDVKYTVLPDGTEKRSAWLTKSEREQAKAESWKELKRTFFTLVPVFDITQTTASPDVYPKLCGLGGVADATSERVFKGISNYCEQVLNCPVTVCDFGERKASVRGLYYPDRNEIHISDMLEGENKTSTTLHEAGHAELHREAYKNASKSTAQIELEADMYALMLERSFGIEPTDARCEHLKAHYDQYLAEKNVSELNDDDEVFNNVIDRYRNQAPLIMEYVNNSMLAQTQGTEQTETQRNDAHITPKRTM